MDPIILSTPFLPSITNLKQRPINPKNHPKAITITSSIHPDPWSLSDGNPKNLSKPKPRSKIPKNPLSDDNARRIINGKARYLSQLRKNQGPWAQTPKWIKRTPEQMVRYLEDDRNGHLYGRHVVAAIKAVRGMAGRKEEERNVRLVMGGFVGKLSFREMCVVLKEQKGWREARDFFSWMKLQLSYRPSVIVYTILLRTYGQVGKIKLAEQTFLEMLEAGCEPDEVACGTMLCSYARWGRHEAMFSFYSALKQRRIVPSVAVYNFMLSSLQKKALHGNVIELWREMVDDKVEPNRFTYTVVISSFVKEGLHDEGFKIFNMMRNGGHVPEEVTYSLLINVSIKNGNWDKALQMYEVMRSLGIVPSNFTCASLLSLYYKMEDYPRALSLFAEMQSKRIRADEVIFGLLIRIYGKLGLYDEAQKTFEEVEKVGALTDEKTYLAMAQVHLTSGNYEKALNVIEVMKSKEICFSRFAYIVLLQCYVMKEDLCSAEETFQALSRTGPPDTGSCSDILNLYINLGLTKKAKDFIAKIRKDKLDFDEELYKTVIKELCKEGMLKDIEELVEKMRANQSLNGSRFFQTFLKAMHGETGDLLNLLAANQIDTMALKLILCLYLSHGNFNKTEEILKVLVKTDGGISLVNQLVSKLIREGDLCKAGTVYAQVTKLGFRLEDETSASLIKLCGEHQKLKQAQEFFAVVVESPRNMRLIYNAMIEAYGRCGKPHQAYSLCKESIERGYDTGAVHISIAVNALSSCGKHRDAEMIIRKWFEESMELDTIAYNTFIKAMLEAGRLHFAASIYERMLSVGVTPTIQTHNTMISVYGRGRKLDKAVEIFNIARSFGLLDEKAYMNMITYYGKAGRRLEASLLFAQMQEEGIKPGMVCSHVHQKYFPDIAVSYNIMMNLYAVGGYHHEVQELFQAMQRDGCAPDSFMYLSIVRAYAKSLKFSEAEETINAMQNNGLSPTCGHFNHLLFALAKADLMVEAERVFRKLLGSGLSPDMVCYRTMIKGYLDSGLVEEGIKFYEQISDFAKRDKFILSATVHFYRSVGKESDSEGILESMNCQGIPFLHKLKVGLKTRFSNACQTELSGVN